ncbi:DUF6966 domain-containing protein [Aliiglaciecola litoralis]|uniref:DUF6966 domain-containing protein n=1 Tax=Aliiglaciecola litoralis TaxID=582857 RepID=A0ABN1LLN6_9ALTE
MKSDHAHYKRCLDDLHHLLKSYNEDFWAKHFFTSITLLNEGKPNKSMRHCLIAYGGMGSFNDFLEFTGANSMEATRGFELRQELWQYCHNNYSGLKTWFEW